MEFQLTPDQQAFIHRAVANGRYASEEDALRNAMARWEEGERTRIELLAALDEAEVDLEAGQYTDHTDDNLLQLIDALKREARTERDTHPPA